MCMCVSLSTELVIRALGSSIQGEEEKAPRSGRWNEDEFHILRGDFAFGFLKSRWDGIPSVQLRSKFRTPPANDGGSSLVICKGVINDAGE